MKKEVSLHINSIRLSVHLGVTAEERKLPQAVDITIGLHFPEGLLATQTDNLKDTICYFELISVLKTIFEKKEFKLIEHLGATVLLKIKETIDSSVRVRVAATKVAPPVPEITGGVTFVCGDLI